MKAIKANMKDQILDKTDHKILHCLNCDAEFSGNRGDYWDWPEDKEMTCADCEGELELVTKKVKITYY